MTESALSIDFTILQREVGRFLGLDSTAANWSSDQTTLVGDIINSGLRQFYLPPGGHQWSFMRPVTTLTTSAAYSTGTVTIAAGVVTLTGGTWPTWAASGQLTVAGSTYQVSVRTDGTHITLVDTSVTQATAKNYSLGRAAYDLADDFGGFDGPITYQPGIASFSCPIELLSEAYIRQRKQVTDDVAQPTRAAIRPKAFVATTGQRFEILFDPTPDAAYILTYAYKANPSPLDATNKYPLGGLNHAETILASVLAIAEQKLNDARGDKYQQWIERLGASVAEDEKTFAADRLGLDGMGPIQERHSYGPIPSYYTQYTGHTLYGG